MITGFVQIVHLFENSPLCNWCHDSFGDLFFHHTVGGYSLNKEQWPKQLSSGTQHHTTTMTLQCIVSDAQREMKV